MRRVIMSAAVTAAVVLWGLTAGAIGPDVKCQSAKLNIAGKYAGCRLKAESKAVKKGEAANFSKCDSKYVQKWQSAEAKAGGQCPTNGDETAIESEITDHTGHIAACLAGSCPPLSCELPATGQTSCWDGSGSSCTCGAPGCVGHDGDDRAGAALSYADNGDGTITDLNTGLMWEKKSDDGGVLHDMDNLYYWDEASSPSIWQWISDVNAEGGTGFAGHNDWRIPNVKELQSIIDYERWMQAVDPVFNTNCTPGCTVTTCSCTGASFVYWSSTSAGFFRDFAWYVIFTVGAVDVAPKSEHHYVRAVRGGS